MLCLFLFLYTFWKLTVSFETLENNEVIALPLKSEESI